MIEFYHKPRRYDGNMQEVQSPAEYSVAPQVHAEVTTHGQPSLGITRSNRLTEQAWQQEEIEEKYKPWNSTVQGRGMIRLFSRGVLGATFFALGGRYARESMLDYNPKNAVGITSKFSHIIAKGIDEFAGKPIENLVNALGHDGKAFVTFRPTRRGYGTQNGISLGHEAFQLTADFAAASVGDGIGRDLATALDPNIKQNWVDDKGRINYNQVAKNIGYNSWKYLTYNQGEDWAVALPYAFFCRWQRNAIEKFSPGFGYDSDRKLNGASFKVDRNGQVTGNYVFEGALDLQTRFTAYNVGTLMFREAYTEAAQKLSDWKKSGFKLPELNSITSLINNAPSQIGNLLMWTARDVVKGTLYMTPAVPAFWMTRVPQSKYRAAFINPEEGIVAYKTGAGKYDMGAVHAYEIHRSSNKHAEGSRKFTHTTPTMFAKFEHDDWHVGNSLRNPLADYGPQNDKGNSHRKYPAYDTTYGFTDALVNPLGQLNNTARKKAHAVINYINHEYGINLDTKKFRGKNLADAIVNATSSYTPYFYFKSDVLASYWDTAKMDMSLVRGLKGLIHLDLGEVTESAGEVLNIMWNKPLADPAREIEGELRICNDKSAADGQNNSPANAECKEDVFQDITMHSKYHQKANTKRFIERLSDSKTRSQYLLNGFKNDEAKRFTNKVAPAGIAQGDSFAEREQWKKSNSREDFPDIGTTLH